jgi:hypothetical protein
MTEKENDNEPFMFTLVRQCLEEDRDDSLPPEELSDKELYSTFAYIIIVVAFLALTVGPFSLLK